VNFTNRGTCRKHEIKLVEGADQISKTAFNTRYGHFEFRENSLPVKQSKCYFAVTEVPFCGHIVSREGIKVVPEKVKGVLQWPLPKDQKSLLSFLGICS
jgi:hypothetical protein